MGVRILLIEDDPYITRLLHHHFQTQGHDFFCLPGGAPEQLQVQDIINHAPDVLLLDWVLPIGSGIGILQQLREFNRFHTPVIMLTARISLEDRVQGLRTGADDYLCKPFELAELDARIEAVLRRAQKKDLTYSDTHLDISFKDKKVSVGGVSKALSAQEWMLLETLLTAKGPLSREQLAEAVWGMEKGNSQRSIDMAILRLRRAVEPNAKEPTYIVSQRGVGYRFNRQGQSGSAHSLLS